MLATIINCIAVIAGGMIGSICGNKIGEKYTKTLMTVMALITALIGIQSAIGTNNVLIVVVCLVLGTLLGIALKLDDRLNNSGEQIKKRLSGSRLAQGRFADAFVTSSLLFCIGAMSILGSIQAGLNQDYSILLTKSIMDFTSAIAFSAALGPGVMLAAVPVLVIQGAITLLAGVAEPYLTAEVVAEMSSAGGVILMGMALNLLELPHERIKVGDMIPAIFLPVLYFPLAAFFNGLF